jgi:hypothetical protein
MATHLKTQIVINATPQKVWQVLTNFSAYPNWNPFIKELTGNVIVGRRIKARIEPPNTQGMPFKPLVLVYTPNQEFRWKGNFIVPGLFDGEHIFELADNGNGTTTFTQAENFSGILVPLFKKMIDGPTKHGFEAMNAALKKLAEQ